MKINEQTIITLLSEINELGHVMSEMVGALKTNSTQSKLLFDLTSKTIDASELREKRKDKMILILVIALCILAGAEVGSLVGLI